MFKRSTYLLAAGAAVLTACGDYTTAPDPQLTGEDVEFLVEILDATAMDMFDDIFGTSTNGPDGAPALTHEPVVWTRTFERSRPCHEGGTLTVKGSGTSVWDSDAVTYDVESIGTKTRTDCAYWRDGVIITLNGTGAWTHERHHLDHAPTGTWLTTYLGVWDWTKKTGESGRCFFDLTVTIDTAANTRTVAGKFCGEEINRSRTWRDG